MKHAFLPAPWPPARSAEFAGNRDGFILVPRDQPIPFQGFVESNGPDECGFPGKIFFSLIKKPLIMGEAVHRIQFFFCMAETTGKGCRLKGCQFPFDGIDRIQIDGVFQKFKTVFVKDHFGNPFLGQMTRTVFFPFYIEIQ